MTGAAQSNPQVFVNRKVMDGVVWARNLADKFVASLKAKGFSQTGPLEQFSKELTALVNTTVTADYSYLATVPDGRHNQHLNYGASDDFDISFDKMDTVFQFTDNYLIDNRVVGIVKLRASVAYAEMMHAKLGAALEEYHNAQKGKK